MCLRVCTKMLKMCNFGCGIDRGTREIVVSFSSLAEFCSKKLSSLHGFLLFCSRKSKSINPSLFGAKSASSPIAWKSRREVPATEFLFLLRPIQVCERNFRKKSSLLARLPKLGRRIINKDLPCSGNYSFLCRLHPGGTSPCSC